LTRTKQFTVLTLEEGKGETQEFEFYNRERCFNHNNYDNKTKPKKEGKPIIFQGVDNDATS